MRCSLCRQGTVSVQVEAMQRRAAYERDQLLARIQSDTEKAHDLLAQRTALQEQRRAANMAASFQRQKLMQVHPRLTGDILMSKEMLSRVIA